MIDKNGTSYLTTTGKEKQTTLGILGVYNCHYIIVVFFEFEAPTSKSIQM